MLMVCNIAHLKLASIELKKFRVTPFTVLQHQRQIIIHRFPVAIGYFDILFTFHALDPVHVEF
jgi:hypothetical protein